MKYTFTIDAPSNTLDMIKEQYDEDSTWLEYGQEILMALQEEIGDIPGYSVTWNNIGEFL